jgi:acetyl-CoA C-acetyltransferase
VVLLRQQQYRDALADEYAFQKRYMTLPYDVPDPSFKKSAATLESDDGIQFSSAGGLPTLKPVLAGGTVTLAGQTHPADGNAGIILAEPERAGQLCRDATICVRLHGFGSARAALAHMPEAPIPAAKRALDAAGVSIERMDAVKTHNPFAVNDVLFSRQSGFPLKRMNTISAALLCGATRRRRWAPAA